MWRFQIFSFLEFRKKRELPPCRLVFSIWLWGGGWDFFATFLFTSFVSPSRRSFFLCRKRIFCTLFCGTDTRTPALFPKSSLPSVKQSVSVRFCSVRYTLLGERPQWKDTQVRRIPCLDICCNLEMPVGKQQSKKINFAPLGVVCFPDRGENVLTLSSGAFLWRVVSSGTWFPRPRK